MVLQPPSLQQQEPPNRGNMVYEGTASTDHDKDERRTGRQSQSQTGH